MNTECWSAAEFSRLRPAKTDHCVSLSNPARATAARLRAGATGRVWGVWVLLWCGEEPKTQRAWA